MEIECEEHGTESRETAEQDEHHLSFWVVRVPEAVFSTDPQDSLRVGAKIILYSCLYTKSIHLFVHNFFIYISPSLKLYSKHTVTMWTLLT